MLNEVKHLTAAGYDSRRDVSLRSTRQCAAGTCTA